MLEELHDLGWNHGSINTRTVMVHTNSEGVRRVYISEFDRLIDRNDKALIASKENIWNSDQVYFKGGECAGVEDNYAMWLVALEVFIGRPLLLATMKPEELLFEVRKGYEEHWKNEDGIFRLLSAYFNASGEEVTPTLSDLEAVLHGEKPDCEPNL